MEGVYMENLVLSCAGEGSSAAMEGTVGPSLATVWVVAWTGIEKALAKVRSFCVVRTLFGKYCQSKAWLSREGEEEKGGWRVVYILSNSWIAVWNLSWISQTLAGEGSC
jgi:hypothetical protein